jgi:hypothetical protein
VSDLKWDLGFVSARQEDCPPAFGSNTYGSARVLDLRFKISNAGSGSGSMSESLLIPFPTSAIG